ncbi:hypothetical protein DSO57_1030922 [Entomophthora muscae]|uniref:Uncharacterized protein n=1 Tax=Entomophthora muscae TaxID=34485 RepID=A0ACC2TMQ8_9FUNG|nr:hypothetical protein DSO57_1030922 [Entomophthora muscae]
MLGAKVISKIFGASLNFTILGFIRNAVPYTPPSRPSHPPSNLDSQTTTHCLPTTSDDVPFTGADDGNIHPAHSLPYLSYDE